MLAVIFMAERTHSKTDKQSGRRRSGAAGLDSFTPQASAVPDSAAEREAERAGAAQTELFPLATVVGRRHDGVPRIQ